VDAAAGLRGDAPLAVGLPVAAAVGDGEGGVGGPVQPATRIVITSTARATAVTTGNPGAPTGPSR